MGKITPWLWFATEAEEAANYYVSIFKNSRITAVNRVGEGSPLPPGSVVTASFELDGQQFVALNGGTPFGYTEAVSFYVDCADQAEVDYYWERLLDGGEPSQCGWLKDRYGVSWQIVPARLSELLADPDPQKAARVTRAMLGMVKLDVAGLEAAAAAA
jgi:predicted 3-demethylubiquinone-9 3-methyltransferase (glyoxalase superfamily)